MRDRTALIGMSTAVAARRLLKALGIDATGAVAVDPNESLLDHLERYGVTGRVARIESNELAQLEAPILAQSSSGRWILIKEIRAYGMRIEDLPDHEQIVSHAAVQKEFSGVVFDRTLELPPAASLWSRLARLVWLQRRMLFPVVGFAIFVQLLELLSPQLTRTLVDDAFPQSSASLVTSLALGMILIALLKGWAGWLEQRCAQLLQARLDAILERGLLLHVMRLPFRYIESRSLGELMQGFQGIAQARSVLTGDALTAAFGAVTTIALLVMMSATMIAPTMFVAAVGVASALLAILAGQQQYRIQQSVVDAQVKERDKAAEIFTHIATLKSGGATNRAVDAWLALVKSARKLAQRSDRLMLGSQVGIDLLGQIQVQALWIWGGLRVMAGSLQLGELLAFILMAALFHSTVGRLAKTFVKLRTVKPHLRETQTLLEQQPIERPRSRPPRAGRPAIEIRNLWFRYADDRPWVFQGLDLNVAPGELHHLDGASGFGKTTLLKLVSGLYDPCDGSISIGGCGAHEARERMIYLPQQVRMLNASVRDNLRLFSAGAPFHRILRAAEVTGLAEMVDQLPMGYDTLIAHGGGNFSGGQRQLVALTAALAADREILLLDEATANLDALSARRVMTSPLFEGRTVLYAGHASSAYFPDGRNGHTQETSGPTLRV
ncbi:peptidase domain-containing ABC transporter [Steroidobacter flavus]|uniref:Peptidase domain-containing ABC transporter n=1 Tax=Steroidobacter flavus TaxID=1842136 RepID=A0ABV8SP69_9GAMM